MAIVVQPHGKLNREGSLQLQSKLAQLHQTARRQHSTWIVDMINVRTIDRDGLVALMAIRRQAQQARRRFLLRNVPKSVRSMLEIACLDEEFDIDPFPCVSRSLTETTKQPLTSQV